MRLRSELPDFEGVTEWVNGSLSKADLAGKPVLIHFWAVSCHMCKESLPQINEWRTKYEEEFNLKVLGVHMPRSEKDTDIPVAKETIEKYELEHPVMIDNQHAITDKFQNEYVPAYYLFDENHQLRHFQAGEKGLKMVEQRINKILTPKE
ncbi:redoxin domain-containing protein [Chengkuizengella axinellae]|uniref:Redoxin domain-containing protein n=1 Tax=Chengkuizengella axinellae TaxID=3064388 RepID=A0ABT9J3M7_9BACL|nr:redoxin domain-containing protein [Chengkuizengella sp. 2205SS18-9]MDP5276226.1 redoxin domain-containing protein [Chengkuizengella sp. 2205SS18-9]